MSTEGTVAESIYTAYVSGVARKAVVTDNHDRYWIVDHLASALGNPTTKFDVKFFLTFQGYDARKFENVTFEQIVEHIDVAHTAVQFASTYFILIRPDTTPRTRELAAADLVELLSSKPKAVELASETLLVPDFAPSMPVSVKSVYPKTIDFLARFDNLA